MASVRCGAGGSRRASSVIRNSRLCKPPKPLGKPAGTCSNAHTSDGRPLKRIPTGVPVRQLFCSSTTASCGPASQCVPNGLSPVIVGSIRDQPQKRKPRSFHSAHFSQQALFRFSRAIQNAGAFNSERSNRQVSQLTRSANVNRLCGPVPPLPTTDHVPPSSPSVYHISATEGTSLKRRLSNRKSLRWRCTPAKFVAAIVCDGPHPGRSSGGRCLALIDKYGWSTTHPAHIAHVTAQHSAHRFTSMSRAQSCPDSTIAAGLR